MNFDANTINVLNILKSEVTVMKIAKKLQKRRESKKFVTLYNESAASAYSAAGKNHCSNRKC